MMNFFRCRRGASAVEFAIVLPIFLTMLFGIVVFGSYFAMVHGVEQLAAEAALSSIASLSGTHRSSLATAYVSANVGTYPLIVPAKVAVNAGASASDPNVFVVTVSYD